MKLEALCVEVERWGEGERGGESREFLPPGAAERGSRSLHRLKISVPVTLSCEQSQWIFLAEIYGTNILMQMSS